MPCTESNIQTNTCLIHYAMCLLLLILQYPMSRLTARHIQLSLQIYRRLKRCRDVPLRYRSPLLYRHMSPHMHNLMQSHRRKHICSSPYLLIPQLCTRMYYSCRSIIAKCSAYATHRLLCIESVSVRIACWHEIFPLYDEIQLYSSYYFIVHPARHLFQKSTYNHSLFSKTSYDLSTIRPSVDHEHVTDTRSTITVVDTKRHSYLAT